jgi:hypothetical protein
MPTDDEVVLLFLEIGNLLQALPLAHCLAVLRHTEQAYESEADTELGDFLNELFKLYAYTPVDEFDELHTSIRDLLYVSELDYSMVFEVGSSLLEEVYLKHYLPQNQQSDSFSLSPNQNVL